MTEHTLLVAFTVEASTPGEAHFVLMDRLRPDGGLLDPKVMGSVDSWWVAEDTRYDNSDCDSAVFVKPGKQAEATELLRSLGLAS